MYCNIMWCCFGVYVGGSLVLVQQHGGGYWHHGLPCVEVFCYLEAN